MRWWKHRRVVLVRDDVAHERADLERHLVALRPETNAAFDAERDFASALRFDLRVLDLHVAVTAGAHDERVARNLELELLHRSFRPVLRRPGLEDDRDAQTEPFLGAGNDARGLALGHASELDARSIALRDDD